MLDLFAFVVCAGLSVPAWRRTMGINPILALDVAFGAAFLIRAVGLLPLQPLSITATALLLAAIGLANLSFFLSTRQAPARTLLSALHRRRFVFVCLSLLLLGMLGWTLYKARLAQILGASGFEALSVYDIRAAELQQSDNKGGLLVSALTVLVVFAAVGFYQFGKAWALLAVPGLLVALQGTNRTYVGILVLTLFFAFIAVRASSSRPQRKSRFIAVLVPGLGVVVAMSIYFNRVGQSLQKLNPGIESPYGWFPDGLTSLTLYLTGAPSALAVAQGADFNPWEATSGWTLQAIASALALLGVSDGVPPLAVDSVTIPAPFNMYTGFGDVYFDLGLLGLTLHAVALGLAASLATRMYFSGRILGVFLVSYLSALYVQFYFSNSTLTSSTVVTLLLGVVASAVLDHRGNPAERPASSPDHTSGENRAVQHPTGK